MKLIKYTLAITLVALTALSCVKNETKVIYDESNAVSGVINTPSAIVLEDATKGSNLPAFTWTKSTFGFDAAVNYVVEICLSGNNFQKVKVLGTVNTNSLVIKQSDLQTAMTYLEAPLGELRAVQMRVKSSISSTFTPIVSAVSTFNVTTYRPAEPEYPKVWIVGDYCGWNHANSQFLYDATSSGEFFEGWVTFVSDYATQAGVPQNGFKITYTGGWNGDDVGSNDTEVVNNKINIHPGSDIKLFTGKILKLKLDNRNQNARTLEKVASLNRIGVVGSATPSGWGSPDVEMKFNPTTREFQALNVTLTTGEIKFRADDDWALSWGTFASSANKNPDQLTSANGNNIAVNAGTYNIYFNLNKVDPTYRIVAVQ